MAERGGYSVFARRRKEAAKIDASLERAFKMPLPIERGRMERRIVRQARDDPESMVTILLKYYDNPDRRVQRQARKVLGNLTGERAGMDAVMHDIIHPNHDVRKAAVAVLSERYGFHAATYASFYEHTALLNAMARNKDIPIDDIEALATTSRETFLDGEVLEALQDIAACLDFIKHRLRSAQTLKNYVAEMLRMAPDLTRMGVYSDSIEEPLKKAIRASRFRMIDETSDIIVVRTVEASIRNNLNRIGKTLAAQLSARPSMDPSQLQGGDVWALSAIQETIQSVTALVITDKRERALNALNTFLSQDFSEFCETAKERTAHGDQSALFTIYTITIVSLKLASYLMPQSAEDIYQRHFRLLELEPSVHIVMWPDVVMRIIQ
jgi:hypothetical protein